jgi:D-serine deaminase-like pyridoxal phosphate-dependent protein|eukprot:COSAG01_NODE_4769_length_4754_cov_10.669388_3_plen_78_part_00
MTWDTCVPQGLHVKSLSAEHTIFDVDPGTPALALGQRVMMVPYYSDATMMLHRLAYGVRGGVVEAVWSLGGSVGRLQ